MKCRLCGENLGIERVICRACSFVLSRWNEWAARQQRATGRWAKLTVEFGPRGAKSFVDSTGGMPGNEFQETVTPRLASADAVHIRVMQHGPHGLPVQSMADIAFYLRLKATPGCTSKLDHISGVMHLYIEPGSEAAELFVSRYLRKRLPQATQAECRASTAEELEELRTVARLLSDNLG